MPDPIDHSRLLAEIEDDARMLRREGAITPAFERQLDALFDRIAPAATSDDLDHVITSAEERSFVNADVVAESKIKGGAIAKHGVRRLVYWYFTYVTEQVQSYAVVATRALRLLARRIERIEGVVPALDERVVAAIDHLPPTVDVAAWESEIVTAMRGAAGRVVHGDCGAGAVAQALAGAGVDAYGVEPRLSAADAASAVGVEVRDGDMLDHLRLVPDGVLGGVVLSGCVDRYPLPWQIALVDESTRALGSGGRLVVVSISPDAWGVGDTVVAADLAPGRPLHAATWEHLLKVRGYEGIRALPGSDAGRASTALISASRPTS